MPSILPLFYDQDESGWATDQNTPGLAIDSSREFRHNSNMILSVSLAALALAGSPYRPLPDEKVAATRAFCAKEKQVAVGKAASAATASGGISNLPYAMGRRFRTLDEYLVHLKCRAAPIDLPWWREVRPGVYRFETTKPGAPQQLATRAELMKRFGFAE